VDHDFSCPHCGANLAENARFCRECGADDDVGWHEDGGHDYDDYSPDDDFDYDEFVRNEFPEQAEPQQFGGKNPLVLVIIIALILAMLGFVL
jgi:hypothetical protein